MTSGSDSWASGNSYDFFMGRWSRLVADKFVGWIDPQPKLHWLDLGCGTGALTAALLEHADPASILACDPSEPLLELARERIRDQRVAFQAAGAHDFKKPPHQLSAFVSGLVLNFIEDPRSAMESIARQLAPHGIVAGYVWDYSHRMEFLRVFWDVATALDPNAAHLDEGNRFPLCAPTPLRSLFEHIGLANVEVTPLDVSTDFKSFSDYWEPFLGGTGPAPNYVNSLGLEERERLEHALRAQLSPNGDRGFALVARAWAACGST